MNRRLIILVLSGIAVPFTLVGGIFTFVVPPTLEADINRLRSLPVATLEMLKEPGAEVLVVGKISDRTPTREPGLVAYREYHRTTKDGETTWEERMSHTPQLWLTMGGSEVTLEPGYNISRTSQELEFSGRLYSGLQVADQVLVLGRVAAVDDIPTIDAEVVSFDNKETYLASLVTGQKVFRWVGVGLLAVGFSLLLVSAAIVFQFWRHSHQ